MHGMTDSHSKFAITVAPDSNRCGRLNMVRAERAAMLWCELKRHRLITLSYDIEGPLGSIRRASARDSAVEDITVGDIMTEWEIPPWSGARFFKRRGFRTCFEIFAGVRGQHLLVFESDNASRVVSRPHIPFANRAGMLHDADFLPDRRDTIRRPNS